MIVINLVDLANSYETIRFDPDSNRPNFVGLKNGNPDSSLPGWDILKLTYHGPASYGVKDIQKAKGRYDERYSLFASLPRPVRVKP